MYLVMDKVLFKIFKTMSTDSLLWRNFSARVKLIRVREEKFNSDAACMGQIIFMSRDNTSARH